MDRRHLVRFKGGLEVEVFADSEYEAAIYATQQVMFNNMGSTELVSITKNKGVKKNFTLRLIHLPTRKEV